MSSLDESLRRHARREHRGWGLVERLGGAGLVLVGVAPAILGGPLLFVPLGAMALFVPATAVGFWKSSVANDKANDPPRDDYLEQTLVEESTVDYATFGEDDLELASANFLRTGLRVVAYERAMVLADERAQGASLAGVPWAESDRRAEALDFGTAAAGANRDLAEASSRLADLLDQVPRFRFSDRHADEIGRHLAEFPAGIRPSAARLLIQAGVDLDALGEHVREDPSTTVATPGLDPTRALANALRAAGAASDAFGVAYLDRREQLPPMKA